MAERFDSHFPRQLLGDTLRDSAPSPERVKRDRFGCTMQQCAATPDSIRATIRFGVASSKNATSPPCRAGPRCALIAKLLYNNSLKTVPSPYVPPCVVVPYRKPLILIRLARGVAPSY